MYISNKDRAKKILIITLSVLVTLLIGCLAYMGDYISKIWAPPDFDASAAADDYETDPDAGSLPDITGAFANAQQQVEKQASIDILLLGVDNRSPSKFSGRSDVIMYLRIDIEKKSIKLASLMRDTLVHIDGYSDNKLNTAYRYGSTDLAEQTISENFGLMPDYYIVVNFYGMEDIIDTLGGVDVKIKRNELSYLNDGVDEINYKDRHNKSPRVKKYGEQHLNGRQAVAYMRIRHTGNGDAERTQRQRTVLSELFKKINGISLDKATSLINICVDYIRTDIPLPEMLEIAENVKGFNVTELQTFRYPDEYDIKGYKHMSVVLPKDGDTEIAKLQDFIEN